MSFVEYLMTTRDYLDKPPTSAVGASAGGDPRKCVAGCSGQGLCKTCGSSPIWSCAECCPGCKAMKYQGGQYCGECGGPGRAIAIGASDGGSFEFSAAPSLVEFGDTDHQLCKSHLEPVNA